MEEKKNKSNLLTIILVILLIIAVGVICYLLGSNNTNDNIQNNNTNVEEKEENNQSDVTADEESKDEEVEIQPTSYIPKCSNSQTPQNLLVDIDESKYNNISEYIQLQDDVQLSITYCKDGTYDSLTYNLSDLEKNNVLNEMKSSVVSIEKDGIGGACVPSLKINYKRNNKEYYVSYYGTSAMTSDDGNIYKIFDKSVNNTLSEPSSCLYYFNNLSNTATSLMNNLKSS